MRDTLAAFAAYCQRNPLDRRPTVYVRYIDMWNEPRGEIGVPDPQDISHTAFALLTPWAMVPTMAEAWLVVDTVKTLEVTRLFVALKGRGIFEPHWSVPYSMSDDGRLSFGEPAPSIIPAEIGHGLQAAKKARNEQTFWEFEHSIETVMPVVIGLLEGPESILPE